jgi:hypothetical protein
MLETEYRLGLSKCNLLQKSVLDCATESFYNGATKVRTSPTSITVPRDDKFVEKPERSQSARLLWVLGVGSLVPVPPNILAGRRDGEIF